MTIYGKSLYNTKKVQKAAKRRNKKKPELKMEPITSRKKADYALAEKYGVAQAVKCKVCGEKIYLIKGEAYKREICEAGCHEKHICNMD